jgi:hypothetical protein
MGSEAKRSDQFKRSAKESLLDEGKANAMSTQHDSAE